MKTFQGDRAYMRKRLMMHDSILMHDIPHVDMHHDTENPRGSGDTPEPEPEPEPESEPERPQRSTSGVEVPQEMPPPTPQRATLHDVASPRPAAALTRTSTPPTAAGDFICVIN